MDSDVELTEAPAIIPLDMRNLQTSCSFGVPLVGLSKSGTEGGNKDLGSKIMNRDMMDVHASKMSEEDALGVWLEAWDLQSLDGFLGMPSARKASNKRMILKDCEAWSIRVGRQWDAVLVGLLMVTLDTPYVSLIDYGGKLFSFYASTP
jgi:hypothetical protein